MKSPQLPILLVTLLGLACANGSDTQTPQSPDVDTMQPPAPKVYPEAPEQLGGERPADYYLPSDYTAEKSWPLVVLLHGYSADGPVQNFYLGLSDHVDDLGFILLIPNGTVNPDGLRFWNATDSCCDNFASGVDDEAFLLALLDEAGTYFNVDTKRVSLIGHSNGGFMAFHMACHAGERIAAIANLAGSSYFDEADCPGTTPVGVLQIHGTEDESVAHEGVPKSPVYGGYPSGLEIVERWRSRNGCDDEPTAVTTADYEKLVEGDETDVTEWSQCTSGKSVALWHMNEVGHIPLFTPPAMPLALSFLLAQ